MIPGDIFIIRRYFFMIPGDLFMIWRYFSMISDVIFVIPAILFRVLDDFFVRRGLGWSSAGPPKAETLVLRKVFKGFWHGSRCIPWSESVPKESQNGRFRSYFLMI